MDSIEKRIEILADFFNDDNHNNIYWKLREFKDKEDINEDIINQIVELTGIRIDWLLSGDGDVFLTENEYQSRYIKSDVSRRRYNTIKNIEKKDNFF